MSQSLVTIGHYWSSVDARLARIHLEAAGINSVLQNENSVTTNWLEVANASRGVQLQVAESDVEAAMRVLEEKVPVTDENRNEWDTENAADKRDEAVEPQTDQVADFEDDLEYTPLNRREQYIQRAYIAAMLGILFFPLEFFALQQLILAAFLSDPLRASVRRKLLHSWTVILLVSLAYVLFLAQATGHIALPLPAPDQPA